MRILTFIALAAMTCAAPAAAQDRSSIIVVGVGRVEREPDRFKLTADIEGFGRTQVEALEQLALVQARVSDNLINLDGLDLAVVTTTGAQVDPGADPDCVADRCPLTRYSATVTLSLEGSPVARAGDAVSLASESGARSAALRPAYLSSSAEPQREANRAAFLDARRQAELLAEASGQRIVRVTRIQPQGVGMDGSEDEMVERIPLGRSVRNVAALAPQVHLTVSPEPVEMTARLTVWFEVE